MTTVYFVRHAQPDLSVHDDLTRPLTEKGLQDRKKVTDYFRDKHIDQAFSSPFKRAIDTIQPVIDEKKLTLSSIFFLYFSLIFSISSCIFNFLFLVSSSSS